MPASYLLPDQPCRTVGEYRAAGLGDAVAAARRLGGRALVDSVEASGLRSRDHAARSVGRTWAPIAAATPEAGPRYLVANGTDTEPGSFTDRALLRANPLGVVEGVAVAALALGATEAFIAIRRSFEREYELLTTALAEAEVAGWLDHVSVKCVRTAEEYLVGDTSALLECIEGRAPLPVHADPAVAGLFADDHPEHRPDGRSMSSGAPRHPTVVETLETLVNVAAIAVNGHRWFRSMGTAVSPGNLLCTLTGDVERHGVVEVELGRRLYDIIEEGGGGFLPTSPPKAVLSGVSSPVLTRSRLAAPLCWEGMSAVGADLGRAAFTVYGEPTDMFEVAHRIAAFLYVESCGLCPACKFGGGEVTAYLARIAAGIGTRRDVEALGGRLATVDTDASCALPSRLREVVSSIMWAFPGDATLDRPPASSAPLRVLEHVTDIVDGRAHYADVQARKRADWVVEAQPVHLTRR